MPLHPAPTPSRAPGTRVPLTHDPSLPSPSPLSPPPCPPLLRGLVTRPSMPWVPFSTCKRAGEAAAPVGPTVTPCGGYRDQAALPHWGD